MLTKPEGTGGRVSVGTVTEQLLYEIDDPARYRTPDVDVDFTSVSLAEQGMDRVVVKGATGQPPSDRLKLVAVYRDGWTASGMLAVVGRDAEAKARAAGPLILERVRRAGVHLADSLVECFGAGDVCPGVIRPAAPPFEVVLRVTVRDPERAAVERFCRELAPLVTSGPPGIAGYAAGRPSPRPAFGYWPALVPRTLAEPRTRVDVRTAAEWAKSSTRITRVMIAAAMSCGAGNRLCWNGLDGFGWGTWRTPGVATREIVPTSASWPTTRPVTPGLKPT